MSLQRVWDFFHNLFTTFRNSSQLTKAKEIAYHRKADQIARLLEAGNFTELRTHFWTPLRWLIPAPLLKKGFELVCLTAGALEHAGTPKTSPGWLLTSVNVPMRFKRAKLAMALTMTPDGSLVGLKFMPQSLVGLSNAWQPPTYADGVKCEEVEVQLGPAKLKVKGTLLLPSDLDRSPCIVMLAGSGPVDRDSTVEACKPFKDLASGLAGQGIATLRFDKVTFTHSSKVRNSKTFTLADEYLEHALDGVRQCLSHERIHSDRIFVLGHSLGGYVAPQLVSMEPRVAGCILMATPAIPMHRAALKQLRHFAALDSESTSEQENEQIKELEQQCELADSADLNLSTPPSKLPFGIGPAYWLNFRDFNPITTSAELGKPLLILQGGRDYQVTANEDFTAWRDRLEERPEADFKMYETLNHLFIAGEAPSTPLDYDTPGNVDEAVILDIRRWVTKSLPRI